MHFVPFPARSEAGAKPAIDRTRATVERIDHDQWTVAGDYDADRPLDRIALNDGAGTEIYISSKSGKIVLTTTRTERLANYAGSIPHWIYPAELRHHREAWTTLMWWLSLLATFGAAIGVIIGLIRIGKSPYQGLQRWHHIAGLIFAPFLLAWIFSGFLSMDDGTWFGHSDALFRALHKLEFGPLGLHPGLRSGAIVGLCLCGFTFSITGATLAWRQLLNRSCSEQ
jgi:hypothetical protein